MNTIIEFFICIMQIIGHLLVSLLGIGGFFLAIVVPIISFFNSAIGNISPKDSIILTLTSTILGSIAMFGGMGLKILLH
jgi:hypothetical protein